MVVAYAPGGTRDFAIIAQIMSIGSALAAHGW
jgi:hypothetical protein